MTWPDGIPPGADHYNGRVCPRVLLIARMRAAVAAAVVVSLLTFAACDSEVSPTPPSPPPPPPPVVVNAPPTIQSITTSSPRVEATEEVQVTAVVQDAETPLDQLTYTWSASPAAGTFTGTGAQVGWRPPAAATPEMAAMPGLFTLTLTVTERYTSAGEAKQNTVSSTVQLHHNNSVAEISKLTADFLTDFGTYSVTPEQCVRNFSDNCRGKFAELEDVRVNREHFIIQDARFSISSVTLNANRTAADIVAPCSFVDIVKATNVRETVAGTCMLTAVYENWRWFLCESRFSWSGTTASALRERLRYGHP
jgi:hypothetical protein